MDNITHSLIGIAAAEPFALRRPKNRALLWLTSALANNIPDLDVFHAGIGHSPENQLNYLLHHRGYTHTILLAPLQSLIFLCILFFFLGRRQENPWKYLIALGVLGPILHILADSWNSYGVHPFWPFNNHWVYGDLLFIIEPWLWVLLLPPILKRSQKRISKVVCLILLCGILAATWLHPLVSRGTAICLSLFLLLWLCWQSFIRVEGKRIASSFLLVFILFSFFGVAKWKIQQTFASEAGERAFLPSPANPLCWTALVATLSSSEYKVQAWLASPWPSLMPPENCPATTSIPEYHRSAASDANHRALEIGTFQREKSELKQVLKSCRARAYLRFARVPYWIKGEKEWRLGDLRFYQKENSFAEIRVSEQDSCPTEDVPWLGPFSLLAL